MTTDATSQAPETAGREVCFLVSASGAILWADMSTSPDVLPDARARWLAIWQHRADLVEIAHSHPCGPLAFSEEDKTTMAAVQTALGKHLRFTVVAPEGVITCEGESERTLDPARDPAPWWLALMRAASGMT